MTVFVRRFPVACPFLRGAAIALFIAVSLCGFGDQSVGAEPLSVRPVIVSRLALLQRSTFSVPKSPALKLFCEPVLVVAVADHELPVKERCGFCVGAVVGVRPLRLLPDRAGGGVEQPGALRRRAVRLAGRRADDGGDEHEDAHRRVRCRVSS